MKNFKVIVEKLDDPDEIRAIPLQVPIHRTWNRNKPPSSDTHDIKGMSLWSRLRLFTDSHIGQDIDKVFSKWCKIVPKYQQRWFLDQFDDRKYPYYFIDEKNLIREVKHRRYRNIYKSVICDFRIKAKYINGNGKEPWYFSVRNRNKELPTINVVESGFEIDFFTSAKYAKRFIADTKKQINAAKREKEKLESEQVYSFLTKEEKELLAQKAKNKIDIERLGFDPVTSFRGNSINPEVIKEVRGY